MMKTIYLLLIPITMVFLVTQVEGAEWVSTGKSPLGVQLLYDRETLTTLPNGIIKMSTKMIYSDEGRNQFIKYLTNKDPHDKRYETFSYALISYEINCGLKENRITSISNYSADGQELDSFTYKRQPSEGWLPIPPLSIAEAMHNVVCPSQEEK
jgi:hypothetical protein